MQLKAATEVRTLCYFKQDGKDKACYVDECFVFMLAASAERRSVHADYLQGAASGRPWSTIKLEE